MCWISVTILNSFFKLCCHMDMQVKSMGCGLLDSIYDVIQLASENNVSSSPLHNTTTEVMEIEPPSKENTGCTDGAHKKSEDNRTGHSVYSLSLSLSLSIYLCIYLSISFGSTALGTRFLVNRCYRQMSLFHMSICPCRCCY
jgi:hypothetical protein